MRQSRLGCLLLLAILAAPRPAAAQSADEAAIRRVLTENYLEGRRTADSVVLGRAFDLEHAHMMFVREGALVDVPIPTYVARVASARTQPEWKPGPPSPAKVTLVDITGNAAVAKIEDRGAEQTVVDYMLLLKTGGEWRVVGKIFDRVGR